MLNTLTTDDNIAGERDVLGGSRLLDTDAYRLKVEYAYVSTSESGALGLFVAFKGNNGEQLRSTQWMTSGTAKGRKNTYEKDGKSYYLPGFMMADTLAMLTTGKPINQLATEEKVIKLYNKDAKAEVPTKVQMVTEMLGQEVMVGVIKQTVDKTTKDVATGEYVATGETRDENEIDKLFCAKETHLNMTVTEIKAQATEAVFFNQWLEANKGKVKNKVKGANGTAGAPKSGAPAAAGTPKPGKSLFS